jgi:hypothetical protein
VGLERVSGKMVFVLVILLMFAGLEVEAESDLNVKSRRHVMHTVQLSSFLSLFQISVCIQFHSGSMSDNVETIS